LEAAKAEAYDEKMKEKKQREVDRILQQRKDLKEQLHNVKLKMIKDYQEAELEGQILKNMAREDFEAKKQ